MFCLMQGRACALDNDGKELRRLQYCGTCKTLGSLYGQRSRLLLNHDTVFLGEVLSALSEDARGDAAWDPSIVSRNCLSLPAKDAARTSPLAFAAAATVVLAEAKLADHTADSGQLRWRLAQYSRSREASLAREKGFRSTTSSRLWLARRPPGALWVRLRRHGRGVSSAELTALRRTFLPTARSAGRLTRRGAPCSAAVREPVYRLDALEDHERDARPVSSTRTARCRRRGPF